MLRLSLTWNQMKSFLASKKLLLQNIDSDDSYQLIAFDGPLCYECTILKVSPVSNEQMEFESSYKSGTNKNLVPIDEYGKLHTRAESRPPDRTTQFTTRGDSTTLGRNKGKRLDFDFENMTDDVEAPQGFKRKRMDISFIEVIRIKEGTFYFHNAPKGSYFDVYIYHPNSAVGQLEHYVVEHPAQGSVPMGDEINTEAASGEIPAGLILRLEVTTPSAVNEPFFNGCVEIEVYRQYTKG
jgi:hypothetical protein